MVVAARPERNHPRIMAGMVVLDCRMRAPARALTMATSVLAARLPAMCMASAVGRGRRSRGKRWPRRTMSGVRRAQVYQPGASEAKARETGAGCPLWRAKITVSNVESAAGTVQSGMGVHGETWGRLAEGGGGVSTVSIRLRGVEGSPNVCDIYGLAFVTISGETQFVCAKAGNGISVSCCRSALQPRQRPNMQLSTAFVVTSLVCGLFSIGLSLRGLCGVRIPPEAYWHVFTRGPSAKREHFTPTGWCNWQLANWFLAAAMGILLIG